MRCLVIMLLWWAGFGSAAASDVFIGTLRAPSGSPEAGGHLYRLDPKSGAATFIGRVMLHGTQPVGLTAMAFHPRTNVLYGITGGINDATHTTLITIDPASAEARVVARLSKPLSDISFSPDGKLFGWTLNTGQLALVDLLNGSVLTLGETVAAPVGGAFAIDPAGNAYVAPWTARGRINQVNLGEGTTSLGPPISSVDFTSLRSMAFSTGGELLATHTVRTASSASTLLRIDTATGQVSAIGAIPEDSEAIAFEAGQSVANAQLLRRLACAIFATVVLAVAWMLLKGRRERRV